MQLQPLGDRVVLKLDKAQETTAGGLYLAADSKEKPQTGSVLAVGPGRMTDKGEYLPMPVEVGDHVVFSKYGHTEIDLDGEEVIILRAEDIYGKFVIE